MTDCNQQQLLFPRCKGSCKGRCKGSCVEARFVGGDITSNGRALPLHQAPKVLVGQGPAEAMKRL